MAKEHDDIDFTPPKAVQQAAQKGLELKDEFGGKGLQDHTVDWARHLADGKPSDPAQARRMRAWFHRHKVDRRDGWDNPPTPGYVAWLLWGGDDAEPWAEGLVEQVEAHGGSDAPLASAKHPPRDGGREAGGSAAKKRASKKKAGKKAGEKKVGKKKAGKKVGKKKASKKIAGRKAGKKKVSKAAGKKKATKKVSKKKASKKRAGKKGGRKKVGRKVGKKKATAKRASNKASKKSAAAKPGKKKAAAGDRSGAKKARVQAAKAVNMRARR